MNRRQKLANDIREFNNSIQKIHSERWLVDKTAYFNLINQIFELRIYDFENNDKYDFFLEFINHDERKKKLRFCEISFNDNYLNQSSYLILSNLLISIEEKIK